jgi:hypothetical protein
MLLEYLSEIKALKSDLQREKLIHEEETYWLRREIADLRKLLSSELGRLPISSIRNLLQKEFPNSI